MDHVSPEQDPVEINPHPAALDTELLARQCDFRATRRGGPGGQNRNKVETAVILVNGHRRQAGLHPLQ